MEAKCFLLLFLSCAFGFFASSVERQRTSHAPARRRQDEDAGAFRRRECFLESEEDHYALRRRRRLEDRGPEGLLGRGRSSRPAARGGDGPAVADVRKGKRGDSGGDEGD